MGRCPEYAGSQTGLNGDQRWGRFPAYFPFSLFLKFLGFAFPEAGADLGSAPLVLVTGRGDVLLSVSVARAGRAHPTVITAWSPAGGDGLLCPFQT